MAKFIVSQHRSRYAIGSSDIDIVDSMPVLPLSALFLTIEASIASGNVLDAPLALLDALKSLQFRYRGTQIWSVRGSDLYRIARAMGTWAALFEGATMGTAARRLLTLCIPFGRNLFSPNECFPAVNKGETELFTSWTAAPTGYQTLKYTLESVQLPEAQPKNFLRCTTMSVTPAATGDVDIDLPRAAPLVGLGYTMTNSEPTNASPDIEKIKILMNNQDTNYSLISSMLARALSYYDRQPGYDMGTLKHMENVAASYTQYALTLNQLQTAGPMQEFGWLDFDPLQDLSYLMDATTATDFKARITFNATNTVRILPVEWWNPNMIIRTK